MEHLRDLGDSFVVRYLREDTRLLVQIRVCIDNHKLNQVIFYVPIYGAEIAHDIYAAMIGVLTVQFVIVQEWVKLIF